jgi:hypothetical protein
VCGESSSGFGCRESGDGYDAGGLATDVIESAAKHTTDRRPHLASGTGDEKVAGSASEGFENGSIRAAKLFFQFSDVVDRQHVD